MRYMVFADVKISWHTVKCEIILVFFRAISYDLMLGWIVSVFFGWMEMRKQLAQKSCEISFKRPGFVRCDRLGVSIVKSDNERFYPIGFDHAGFYHRKMHGKRRRGRSEGRSREARYLYRNVSVWENWRKHRLPLQYTPWNLTLQCIFPIWRTVSLCYCENAAEIPSGVCAILLCGFCGLHNEFPYWSLSLLRNNWRIKKQICLALGRVVLYNNCTKVEKATVQFLKMYKNTIFVTLF